MPAGQGEEAERFAAAVELGRSPRSRGDDELARDLEIVALLRSRSSAYDPSPAAKAQAKQKLMAPLADPAAAERPGAGRLLAPAFPAPNDAPDDDPATELLTQVPGPVAAAESVAPSTDGPLSAEPQSAEPGEATRFDLDDESDDESEAGHRPTAHGTPSRPSRPAGPVGPEPAGTAGRPPGRTSRATSARPALRSAGSPWSARQPWCWRMALAGAGILASRDALPGDGLYTVKRVSESAGLALTFDETEPPAAPPRPGQYPARTRCEQLVATDPKVTTERPRAGTRRPSGVRRLHRRGRPDPADRRARRQRRGPRRPAQLGGRAVGPADPAAAGPAGRRRHRRRPAAAGAGSPGGPRRCRPVGLHHAARLGSTTSARSPAASRPVGGPVPGRVRRRRPRGATEDPTDARTRRAAPTPGRARGARPVPGSDASSTGSRSRPPPTATQPGLLDRRSRTPAERRARRTSDDSPLITSRTTGDLGRRRRIRPAAATAATSRWSSSSPRAARLGL